MHSDKMNKTERRIHVYYSGSVQGVGFRFTAQRAALFLGLKGWVSNLYDGRVEIVCEGREADLKEFLGNIDGTFGEYMRDKDIKWGDAAGEFDGFDIR